MNYVRKIILYLSFGMLLNACGGNRRSEVDCQKSPGNPWCVEEQRSKEEKKQVETQQKITFKNLGDCLRQKQIEEGAGTDSKPTPQMVQQCLALQRR